MLFNLQHNKMSEYEGVVTSSLKLKGVSDSGIKKKKKKSKKKEVVESQVLRSAEIEYQEVKKKALTKTPAELSFLKLQEKRNMEKCLEKASKTHKQRVGEFNRHLDSLTEHYDIPKVSWTK